MPAKTDRAKGLTIAEVSADTGIPADQLYKAIYRGEIKPGKDGRAYVFSNEQVDTLRTASRLVMVGVGLYLALRLLAEGWRPPVAAA